ncbi:MAG: SsrA-binding protein SmpB [Magnetospirillum sp.]|nr:MAG: SsrA-binding protein SmpB [Magnetospirillum sp.]
MATPFIAAQNRRARHEYFISEEIEAGIMLVGTEVKSLRAGKGNVNEAYAGPMKDELYLFNCYIPEYQSKMPFPHETRRPRKLLLHRHQMVKLMGAVTKDGMTLIPLDLHFTERGMVKVLLGLAKGKKLHDKRESAKKADWNREKARVMRDKG